MIKSWCTTQATIAMSSAEAELYSLTKGASNTLGLMSLAADLGVSLEATVHSDASATLSIVNRQGLGKLRHINVQYLWVQDRVKAGEFSVTKVPGKQNPADLMTKHLPAHEMKTHMQALAMETSSTRASIAPTLSSTPMHRADEWEEGTLTVIRTHCKPRSTLFTPLRVSGSPPAKALTAMRLTQGQYLDTGERLTRQDNWTTRTTAHLPQGRNRVGTTTFWKRTGA